jgi:Cof subfamily protein (haloacid dehalogenase superfamily)
VTRNTKHTTPAANQHIRLIATDLDGTLLRPDKTISQYTYTILQQIQAAGIVVVLISARPPRVIRKIAQEIGITGLAICCNGAITYDLDQEMIVQHTPILPNLALRLIQRLRQELPGLSFACESPSQFKCEPRYLHLCATPKHKQSAFHVTDALAFCNEPLTKLIALHPTYSPEELGRLTAHITGEDVIVVHSGAPFIEISAAGVNKAWALATQCEQLGITAQEVVAFGDMPNDLSMLQWAGHAVAVANAHPQVRKAVHEITASNAEDGVTLVLERLLSQSASEAQGNNRPSDLLDNFVDQSSIGRETNTVSVAQDQALHMASLIEQTINAASVFDDPCPLLSQNLGMLARNPFTSDIDVASV